MHIYMQCLFVINYFVYKASKACLSFLLTLVFETDRFAKENDTPNQCYELTFFCFV